MILAQVMISRFLRWSPEVGSVLATWSLLGILSVPLSPAHCPCSCFLSLSLKINKLQKKKCVCLCVYSLRALPKHLDAMGRVNFLNDWKKKFAKICIHI